MTTKFLYWHWEEFYDKKQIKTICKNHNKVVLIKIKTYADDTAKGTFDCRI